MLWGHDAELETRMVVVPDREGRVKLGREQRAEEIWGTRSHSHHNRDFRFNSQPLAVAFTENQTIGGRAWPNVKFDDLSQEIAYTLWGNTTLAGVAVLLVALQPSAGWTGQHADHGHSLDADAGRDQAVLRPTREG